jgi:hypothetical protein
MESIKELRQICQSTRPAIFSDFLSRWYYRVAIYFTWICLKLNLSANQVTVLSGAFAFVGGILIGTHSLVLNWIGVLFFHLFAILDMSDGEVARYRKQGGVTGHYLDWYMHFISSTAFTMGLFMANSNLLKHPILVMIGVMAVVVPIMDKSIQNAGWTVICWTRLRDIKNGVAGLCVTDAPDKEKLIVTATAPQNIIYRRLKFLALAPFQDHWAPSLLLVLIMIETFFSALQWGAIVPNYRLIWLLYMGTIGPIYLFFRVKHMIQSDALKDGYRRLVCPSREIIFPQDDFLS